MTDRADRLSGMTGMQPQTNHSPTQRLDPTIVAPRRAKRQALLYAPPPATPGPYVAVLETEGLDVLVANSPESAAVLLANSAPALIIALAPIVGDDLREVFRKHAPNAELRVFSGLTAMLEDALVRPRDAFQFAMRAIVATAGVLSSARGTPRERTVRILQFAEKAANALRFSSSDIAATCIVAALYDVPQALAPPPAVEAVTPDRRDSGAREKEREMRRALMGEFVSGLGSPFPIVVSPPPGDSSQRMPTPLEVVEAAAALALLVETRTATPAIALRKMALAGDLNPVATEAVVRAATGDRGVATRGRVLIVDGDPGFRNLLALRLANEGYGAEVANDGRSALEIIRREAPSLILSETVLAGMDGFTLLDTLRREGRNIPFVFLSSRHDATSMNKGLLLGAADFLAKPINTEVLLTKLQKLSGASVAAADASARLTLSDMTRGTVEGYETVTYAQLEPGVTILGRFRLVADLGEGGMGKVYKARDERLEEDVVIKVMKDALAGDSKALDHFKREIRLARKISHSSVVRLFDFFEVGPLKFVTMEYLEGTDLLHERRRRGTFAIPVTLRIGVELFEGLAAAHDLGVVHRDIKPHNVYLLSGGHVKILDFGIAQGLDPERPDHTATGSLIGTPDYMSPEQLLAQKVDARTDLYSAGVLLYELLTGSLPFGNEDSTARITARLHRDPDPLSKYRPGIPQDIDAIFMKLLARSRDARYPDARSAADDLRAQLRALR